MKSATFIYNLQGNEAVVRRDLPKASPVTSLAFPNDDIEREAFKERGRLLSRAFELLEHLKPAQPQSPSLVPSADGKIDSMLLTIPADNTSGDFEAIYKKLLETLPSTTQLVCLVNTASKATVENWVTASGRTHNTSIIEAPDHVGFSIWAQDAYAVVKSQDGTTHFIEPLSFLRYADAVIADYISSATSLETFQVPLYFQGGNILVGDDFWMIGADYPSNSLDYVNDAIFPQSGETAEQLVRRLYSSYLDTDRTLHYVGSPVPVPTEQLVLSQENGSYFLDSVFQGNKTGTLQPLFHIDMFLTLVGRGANGKYRILVGDPSLGPAPDFSQWKQYAMLPVFDGLAKSLTKSGFEVIRNPLPLTYSKRAIDVANLNRPDDEELYAIYQQLTSAGVQQVPLRSWYFATANNALVENSLESKRVWLPGYGTSAYPSLIESDNKNQSLWESMGFQVTMLPSFHRLARGLGAVHCIQKYLGRH